MSALVPMSRLWFSRNGEATPTPAGAAAAKSDTAGPTPTTCGDPPRLNCCGRQGSVPHIPSPVRGAVGASKACLGRFSGSLQHAGGQGPCDSRPATQQAGPGLYAIAVPVLVGVVSSAVMTFAVAAWSLSRLGGVVIFPLYFAGVAVFVTILGLIWGLAAVFMASYSIVFLIGGAASFAFGFSPAIGIALVVAGVALEYESRRRRDRESREQLGRVLRIIEQRDRQ